MERAWAIVGQADAARNTAVSSHDYGTTLCEERFATFRASGLSYLRGVFGADHPYYTDFDSRVVDARPFDLSVGMGIITAAREEIEGGWLRSTRGLISAEIFGDFLEMAHHLLEEGYKDAAAVVAGSALEEHLRHLADASGVPSTVDRGGREAPKKADQLNSDLAAAKVYSKLEQKNVTAWLGIRNSAAHGEYGEYEQSHVSLMVEGIRQFIIRVSV